MREKLILLASLILSGGTLPARAAATPPAYSRSEVEKYCQLQKTEAALKSDAVMRPGFFSEYSMKSVYDSPADSPDPVHRYLRAGLEIELHSIRKALKIRDLADARCDYYQQHGAFHAVAETRELNAEEQGLIAKISSLTDSIARVQGELNAAKERLKSYAETLQAVDEVSSRLAQLQLRQVTAQNDLSLVRQKKGDMKDVPVTDAASVGLAEMRVESLQTDLNKRDNWELTLGGGTEWLWKDQAEFERRRDRPYYVALTLRYNLLAPFYSYRRSEYQDALKDWVQADPGNSESSAARAADRITAFLALAADSGQVLTQRKNEIEAVIRTIGNSQNNDVKSFRGRLLYELDEIKAQLAYWQAKASHLKPDGTSGKDAGVNVGPDETRLAVTTGNVQQLPNGAFSVETPKLRAKSLVSGGDLIEAEFFYQGPTAAKEALGSGLERNQFGVYLTALDQCNLLYVMIRVGEKPSVVVQKKINSEQKDHQQCGNNGYQTVASEIIDPELLTKDQPVVLLASAVAGTLSVELNGKSVWSGSVPVEGLGTPGFSGVRTDNSRVNFKILR